MPGFEVSAENPSIMDKGIPVEESLVEHARVCLNQSP